MPQSRASASLRQALRRPPNEIARIMNLTSPGDRGHGNESTQPPCVDSGAREGGLGVLVAVTSVARCAVISSRTLFPLPPSPCGILFLGTWLYTVRGPRMESTYND